MKKLFSIFLLFCIFVSLSNVVDALLSESREPFSKGDINGDSIIDAKDFVLSKRIFLETYNPEVIQHFAADTNFDGVVNAQDFLMIKRFFLETLFFEPTVLREQIPPNQDTIDEIKHAYADYYNSLEYGPPISVGEVTFFDYYNVNDTCSAFFIHPTGVEFPAMVVEKYVAGMLFVYPQPPELTIYDGTEFYKVDEAYDNGVISKDDVYHLSYNYIARHRSFYFPVILS